MVTARLGLPFSLVGMGYRDEDCVRLARWDVSSTEKTDSDCGVVDCGAVDCDAEDCGVVDCDAEDGGAVDHSAEISLSVDFYLGVWSLV